MRIILLTVILVVLKSTTAQLPFPALVGYWHNWNDANAPYIHLDSIDNRYNVVIIAFAMPVSSTNMTMQFVPDVINQTQFIAKIQALQNQGKKVLISVGGATAFIDLTNEVNKNAFISSMNVIIETYGFDGMDIDIEHGNSILITGGTLSTPTNVAQINLIDAIREIMAEYRDHHPDKKLLLTMAPETAYVQGGQSAYGSIWGGYLPIIDALRDSLDLLHVQLYNSGTMYGIDGNIYAQGTADFIVAMTEATMHGFNTPGGYFQGLPPEKIAVGLPACQNAAGGGFADSATVSGAMQYLMGNGAPPGAYTLTNPGGYPSLRGMMTWSINWDALESCADTYQYASIYHAIFGEIIFELRVFLEGAYNGVEMNTFLSTGDLMPLTQPYGSDPSASWYYPGNEAVPMIPHPNITDWVVVELRDAPSAAQATGATVVHRQACFLKKDGTVTGLDGISPPKAHLVFQHQPYIVIRHRNHLPVLSADPPDNPNYNIYTYDFTTGAGKAYGNLLGHKELTGGVYGMISGDIKPDGQINPDDKNFWNTAAGHAGYEPADLNLDGRVDNTDKNEFWIPNIAFESQVTQ